MKFLFEKWEHCLRINIGAKLKWLRYNRFDYALSYAEICRRTDNTITPIELSAIESGNRASQFTKIFPLLNVYNISFNWLMNGETNNIRDFDADTITDSVETNSPRFVVAEKIRRIIDCDTHFIVDENFTFFLPINKSDVNKFYINEVKSNYKHNIKKPKSHKLFTLIRFCYVYNVDINWLIAGNINDIDNNCVPTWNKPKSVVCNTC